MKKIFIGVGIVSLLISCVPTQVNLAFPTPAIQAAENHGVAIAVYYFMGEEEYNKRFAEMKTAKRLSLQYLEQMAFLGRLESFEPRIPGAEYVIAYLGAGGIIKDDHVITVRHLFVHDENTVASRIWVMQREALMPIEASLVAISAGKEPADDYAVLKLSVPLNLPGLKIARSEAIEGEPIVFVGTTGGLAFHTRFSRATRASRYFNVDSQGYLHLSWWEDFEYLMTYPGGPGDSGGIIVNANGELVGIMYCGLEVYAECYVFANPINHVLEFLTDNELEHLAR